MSISEASFLQKASQVKATAASITELVKAKNGLKVEGRGSSVNGFSSVSALFLMLYKMVMSKTTSTPYFMPVMDSKILPDFKW